MTTDALRKSVVEAMAQAQFFVESVNSQSPPPSPGIIAQLWQDMDPLSKQLRLNAARAALDAALDEFGENTETWIRLRAGKGSDDGV